MPSQRCCRIHSWSGETPSQRTGVGGGQQSLAKNVCTAVVRFRRHVEYSALDGGARHAADTCVADGRDSDCYSAFCCVVATRAGVVLLRPRALLFAGVCGLTPLVTFGDTCRNGFASTCRNGRTGGTLGTLPVRHAVSCCQASLHARNRAGRSQSVCCPPASGRLRSSAGSVTGGTPSWMPLFASMTMSSVRRRRLKCASR